MALVIGVGSGCFKIQHVHHQLGGTLQVPVTCFHARPVDRLSWATGTDYRRTQMEALSWGHRRTNYAGASGPRHEYHSTT